MSQDSLICNLYKVTKLFELCNSNSVYMKKLVDFDHKTFDIDEDIVYSMLKAVAHNVNCTFNSCQNYFNIFFYFK